MSNNGELCLTNSNNSSLNSYSSSIADSTITKASSISTKTIKNMILNRKRSQSLTIEPSLSNNSSSTSATITTTNSSLNSKTKSLLMRNRSISSIFPSSSFMSSGPSSSSSVATTRDNSISSLSESELDLVLQPLTRIEENVGKTGKYKSLKLHKAAILKDKETDIKIYDEIADNILNKISNVDNSIDWRI